MPPDNLTNPSKKIEDAVEKLLAFNEQFRSQVESDAKKFQEHGQATYHATSKYTRIVDHADALARFADEIDVALSRLENESAHLTSIAEEFRSILQKSLGSISDANPKIVDLIGLLSRAVADHQRIACVSLSDNALAIRSTLNSTAESLDRIASAAQKQVAILDEAIMVASLKSIGRSGHHYAESAADPTLFRRTMR